MRARARACDDETRGAATSPHDDWASYGAPIRRPENLSSLCKIALVGAPFRTIAGYRSSRRKQRTNEGDDVNDTAPLYEITLDAMAPEELPLDEGVEVTIRESGLAVDLRAPLPVLVEFVARHWGDDEDYDELLALAARLRAAANTTTTTEV